MAQTGTEAERAGSGRRRTQHEHTGEGNRRVIVLAAEARPLGWSRVARELGLWIHCRPLPAWPCAHSLRAASRAVATRNGTDSSAVAADLLELHQPIASIRECALYCTYPAASLPFALPSPGAQSPSKACGPHHPVSPVARVTFSRASHC
jgi:hypothetical protein